MRKLTLVMLTILLFLTVLPAFAEQVNLPAVPAVLQLPDGAYAPILTPENLKDHETFIHAKGGSLAAWAEDWKTQGILMKAYDDKNSRVLVVSAVADEPGQRLMDIDQQTAGIRADYRREHLDKAGALAAQGYRMESAEWKNFSHVGRFLMLKYRYSPGGSLQYRGFARKSVKNGLSIIVDMQVYGRRLKAGDNTALNKVFDTLNFTAATAPGVSMPVVLSEAVIPPEETNQPNVTIKGTTRPGVNLSAVVGSMASTQADNYTAQADAKGNYQIDIRLPNEGVFLVTLTANLEGLEETTRNYPITYRRDMIPVAFSSPELPQQLTQDSYTLSGTTESGVTVQLVVNEQSTQKRTGNNGSFSFKVNTKQEGAYAVRLSFTKKGYNIRTFDYQGVKGSPAEVEALVASGAAAVPTEDTANAAEDSAEAISPPYTDLIAQADQYDGKLLTYDGYLISAQQQGGEWQLYMALRKTGAGYADTIVLVTERDPAIRPDTPIRAYGELVGLSVADEEDSTDLGYPRLQLQSIQAYPGEQAPTQTP